MFNAVLAASSRNVELTEGTELEVKHVRRLVVACGLVSAETRVLIAIQKGAVSLSARESSASSSQEEAITSPGMHFNIMFLCSLGFSLFVIGVQDIMETPSPILYKKQRRKTEEEDTLRTSPIPYAKPLDGGSSGGSADNSVDNGVSLKGREESESSCPSLENQVCVSWPIACLPVLS